MSTRFARDFEVLIFEVDETISRQAAYSTPGHLVPAAAVAVLDVDGQGHLVSTYIDASVAPAALTADQVASAVVALNRDDGDGFAVTTGPASVKDAVVRWPADVGVAATLRAVLTSKKIIAR